MTTIFITTSRRVLPLVTGEAGAAVRVWDSSNGAPVPPIRNQGAVSCLAFNALIRNSLAVGRQDGTVRISDPSTGLAVLALRGSGSPILTIALRPGRPDARRRSRRRDRPPVADRGLALISARRDHRATGADNLVVHRDTDGMSLEEYDPAAGPA